ncbi:hypothetical protein SAMN04487770_11964 [Butyrivibrio sp. ob235]|uniref:hypothetical protein n=1 Tax=Butyrivibrio sp. ob235 TaxID=1761780 RepID=UPI0008CE3348|nr:hypothetical protein [Butyrivibrio sp. ob235]SEL86644.1 hypothetical protein SAMN04487770_11964 [Butyrivibrio sp. ob235]
MKCMKKVMGLVLAGIMSITLAQPIDVKAANTIIAFGTEYTETNNAGTWNYNSAYNNLPDEENCRTINAESAGRITITGSSNEDVRIFLYDSYGGSEIQNQSTGTGRFTIAANVTAGAHYLKFWDVFQHNSTIKYSVTFTPNKIFTTKKGLAFNKENTEYLVDCTYNTATNNHKSTENCRKVVISGKKKRLKITAYALGDSSSDVRIYVYNSKGKKVLANWSVRDGKRSTTIKVKKGTYYIKFWECFGNNTEFHYKLKAK